MHTTMRDNTVTLINSVLKDKAKSQNIEKSIYNFSTEYVNGLGNEPSFDDITFTHVYKQKLLDILKHLEHPEIVKGLKEKKISRNMAYLKPQELLPNKWKDETDDTEQEIQEGIFQCKKCGSKKTTYYSLQTRSSDEPMTNFITCVECKNRWKM
jgi:DNA-directed RNA polymerase subunit M/transcription elongation factor TFIIS